MDLQPPYLSITEASCEKLPLNWVGIQNIDLPIWFQFSGVTYNAVAKVGVQINLPKSELKGIQISSLYQRLNVLSDGKPLTPDRLYRLLNDMLESPQDGFSYQVHLTFEFSFMMQRPASMPGDLMEWKPYSITLEASCLDGQFRMENKVVVEFSSTCQCPATLSSHHIEEAFLEQFSITLPASEVTAWLKQNATLATSHRLQSRAIVTLSYCEVPEEFEFLSVIERIEASLDTPPQTAVKQVDKQTYVELNGHDLMFVEDAIRRVQSAMIRMNREFSIEIQHVESAHSYDAVASLRSPGFDGGKGRI